MRVTQTQNPQWALTARLLASGLARAAAPGHETDGGLGALAAVPLGSREKDRIEARPAELSGKTLDRQWARAALSAQKLHP